MSLNKGSLDKAIRELKVKQLTVENQGTGANPLINSNNALQMLSINGFAAITSDILLKSGTAFFYQGMGTPTSIRNVTFPDKSFTVADNADTTELQAQNLIGAGNKKYMNTIYMGDMATSILVEDMGFGSFCNNYTGNTVHAFFLDMPCNRGTKKLYIDAIRIRVTGADVANYISKTDILGTHLTGSSTSLNADTTHTTTVSLRSNTFTPVDCNTVEQIILEVTTVTDMIGSLSITLPQIRAYYDT